MEETQHLPCLSEAFEENVRPFIDLIDKLRLLGLDKDISLPEVAVIGDQSAGKSSVLEAISGVQLPRGSGIVTRCPLALQLKSHDTPGYWNGVIKYETYNHPVEKTIEGPTEVGAEVREAQDVIAGKNVGISDTLISLQITSHGVPDLTLIDLPGITRVAVEGQPKDIGDQIKRLIGHYIKKEETIILAVVPANVDIATTEALKMAKEVDPSGGRTLGVVTKPDLIDIGTEKGLIDIINNETYPLEKGYSCVRCRGQKAINEGQTLAEAIQQDTDFFSSAPHFSDVDESILGVKNLAMKLTYELVKQIKRALPEMRGQIQEKLNLTKRSVENMTPGIPEDIGQRTIYLLQLLQQYTDGIKNVVSGEHKGLKGPQLVPRCREYYEQLATKIRALTPARNGYYIQHIMELSSGQRGRELPRFLKYSICEALIVEIVEKYEEPLMETLQDVSQLVADTFGKLATSKFENIPHLDRKIKGLVDRLRVEADNACQDALRKLLKMEKRPFAQDDTYSKTLDHILEKEQERKNAEFQPTPTPGFSFGSVQQATPTPFGGFSQTPVLGGTSTAPGHTVREQTRSKDAEQMFHMTKAYITVCNRRLVDYAPMTISRSRHRGRAERDS
ncbi:Interferon-induced GTP-binding protein Mx2 [Lamellibrachia satsuma]|nr:Interferon-induced GTP-binding protein Mx2 [Lamellibrachia satsuma]